ncbi:MAG: hypothetical protein AVDCRST_MAG56-3829 [uncultured Cytophagales bacterium]|uniref:Uncharacterized protein n=1 Tax=uncultured Cytophagales bacterium TaxID=158755 RepID=A0A6J4JKG9_9SPHI|nr:MAG: hypothetical protein AVDCRST_MAG56-3829 [uncultured Cytophagales bacterium]
MKEKSGLLDKSKKRVRAPKAGEARPGRRRVAKKPPSRPDGTRAEGERNFQNILEIV